MQQEIHSPVPKTNRTIIVEGNIGVGKSTFLNYMAQHSNIEILTEPLEKWTDLNGNNLLQLMYENPVKWSYTFQNYTLLTQLENHLRVCNKDIKIMERSIYSTRYCFGRALLYDNKIERESFQVFVEWFNHAKKSIENQVDLIVYLRASPKTAYERIEKRNRVEEKTIPFEYVSRLHEFYEIWLFNEKIPIFVIDANLPSHTIHTEYKRFEQFLLESPQFNIVLQ